MELSIGCASDKMKRRKSYLGNIKNGCFLVVNNIKNSFELNANENHHHQHKAANDKKQAKTKKQNKKNTKQNKTKPLLQQSTAMQSENKNFLGFLFMKTNIFSTLLVKLNVYLYVLNVHVKLYSTSLPTAK